MSALLTVSTAWNLVYGSTWFGCLASRRSPERERGGLIHQSHFCVVTFDACSEWDGLRGTGLISVGSYQGQRAHWGIVGKEPGFKVMTCSNSGTSTGLDPQPVVFSP